MRLGARLVALFVADTTVFGLVGSKIHPVVAPEGEAPPFIVYLAPHASPIMSVDGPDTTRTVLIQISCYARHYEDAHAIADAVEAVFAARSGHGLSMADGPIFGTPIRRDLGAEMQPQWYHVAIDANAHTIDT